MHAEVSGDHTASEGDPRTPATLLRTGQPGPGLHTAGFADAFTAVAGTEDTGLYLVGSPALGDVSPRHSNVDLVAVTPARLTDGELRRLLRAQRSLRIHGRDPAWCLTTWDALREAPEDAEALVYVGSAPAPPDRLANPMTWSILASHPVSLHGRAAPLVRSDPDSVRAWFVRRLPEVLEGARRLLWRRHLTRAVLESTRCAHGALTGAVLSLHRAGEWALPQVSHTGHRVITDALGYREGANTSMYWGPFERQSNALGLGEHWLKLVRSGG